MGALVQNGRFVFLSVPTTSPEALDEATEKVLWMLISSNNRPLGIADHSFVTYAECRAEVARLINTHDRAKAHILTDDITGQWIWWMEVDGRQVAISSRSYLRARECSYNLERFLEAVPLADVTDGVRIVHKGRQAGDSMPGGGSTQLRCATDRQPSTKAIP